ncbi:receptor-like protein 6 isoform X2 [Medicago truncatula]|uniref:receptor-like protein 6 isoform X2 n=1 Tax=Medicago truncatula TaxID=3880 RepID=UPI001968429E|nr:receptor-like protein 6 isoform X2 [Medicago truncatula]
MGWFVFHSMCLFLFVFPSWVSSLVPLCNHDDSSALLEFKNSFSPNVSFIRTKSWKNGTNCCLWDGVSCDTKSGYVIGIDLTCGSLQGKLHPNSTLFHLHHLQTLNLAFNDFSKSQISFGFSNLKALTHLNLSSSCFHGVISTKIYRLSKLVSLDLSELDGTIFEQSTFKKFIKNTTDLKELLLDNIDMSSIKPSSLSLLVNYSASLVSLSLEGNKLQGKLASNLLHLPNLQFLNLASNFNLKSELSKVNWSTSLVHLDLYETSLSGVIPPSFGNITQLTFLNLGANNFRGEIPDSFGKLSKLQLLRLYQNQLVGQLPSSLFGLTQLELLSCGDNKLVGPIPNKISGLSNLKYLYLSNNLLNGTIPQWCYSLSSLLELYLSGNQFTGPIGEFSAYSLTEVDLSHNRLHGNIPNSMFDMKNLVLLDLSSNNLSVAFHKFSKLWILHYLYLSQINLIPFSLHNESDFTLPNLLGLSLSSCKLKSFPSFLNELKTLENLDLSYNQINGRVPSWFNNLGNGTLSSLDLSHNLLTSTGNLSHMNISYIDLSFNMLEGEIPLPPFGTSFFSISNNKLTGDLSSRICNARSLEILNLSHNNFTGKLPQCIGTFQNLSVLDLQKNNLVGIIPKIYFEMRVLETMILNGNQLTGPLPHVIAKWKKLEVLDLGENNIEGSFPSWLESLPELQVLVLRANRFNGTISCLKTNQTFPKLRVFDVSNNNFSGSLPTTYIKNFKGMVMTNVNDGLQYMINSNRYSYYDSVVVTIKGFDLELERILTTFTTLDLSKNKFEGEIPIIIGELKSLIGLNLSFNKITGPIPQSFVGLENLEWLDLSSNKLTGEIPEALTNLYSLSVLNLSLNQLEGAIPSGNQFNTFQNDSYKGNPELCGLPLSKPCHKYEEQPRDSSSFEHDEEFLSGWKAVAIGYASGMVFGILLGYIVFQIEKPQWLIWFVEDIACLIQRKRRSQKFRANKRG